MPQAIASQTQSVEALADSFISAHRAGQAPGVEEYAARFPDLAEELGDLLQVLLLLEQEPRGPATNADPDDTPADKLPLPHAIGDFTILREIGRGGMGVVYEAVQQSLGRHVALKVLLQPSFSRSNLERFRLEASAAARLHHTNIVPVFGVGECDGHYYYAMQLITGQSLDQVIDALRAPKAAGGQSTDPANPGQLMSSQGHPEFYRHVARIGAQAALAIAHAHREGILHRDVKPSNLLLDDENKTWVADFGLAKIDGDPGAPGLTRSGDFIGTLRYMPPERLKGICDQRSDVYGLGATLYELLTLTPLFDGGDHARLVDQVLRDDPALPTRLDRSLPRDLETILLKSLAKEPAARYLSADDMAKDLENFSADRPILARRQSHFERLARWCRRNPALATLSAATAFLLLATVITLALGNAQIRRESNEKDAALATARLAVNHMLTRVANEKLAHTPLAHRFRAGLLEDAIKFYDGFLARDGDSVHTRLEMATALNTLGLLRREMGQFDGAKQSFERSIDLLSDAVDNDPQPPNVRERLAAAHEALAFTWQTAGPSPREQPTEANYARALDLYRQIERDWPTRTQPVVLCLRHLAESAYRRGDLPTAEAHWLDAIASGEKYLQQSPHNLDARSNLCWASIDYSRNILLASNDRTQEAEPVLRRGLEHVQTMRQLSPNTSQARDTSAALRVCLGRVQCQSGQLQQATALFHLGLDEMHALCADFPANDQYWQLARGLYTEIATALRAGGHHEQSDEFLRGVQSQLSQLNENLPTEPDVRKAVESCRSTLANLIAVANPE